MFIRIFHVKVNECILLVCFLASDNKLHLIVLSCGPHSVMKGVGLGDKFLQVLRRFLNFLYSLHWTYSLLIKQQQQQNYHPNMFRMSVILTGCCRVGGAHDRHFRKSQMCFSMAFLLKT